jgi:PadR family transcriptional regulator, regulatory protein PadR
MSPPTSRSPSPSLSLISGTLELLILKTLAAGGELHGFGVLDWIRSASDEQLIVEEGALYHALHRMEARGWVASEWAISEKGRRARYYRLTAKGRKALARQEDAWGRYVATVARIAPGRSPA